EPRRPGHQPAALDPQRRAGRAAGPDPALQRDPDRRREHRPARPRLGEGARRVRLAPRQHPDRESPDLRRGRGYLTRVTLVRPWSLVLGPSASLLRPNLGPPEGGPQRPGGSEQPGTLGTKDSGPRTNNQEAIDPWPVKRQSSSRAT